MAIDDTDRVDVISISKASGNVMLTISDHLEWDADIEKAHLLLLQEKINTYLRFIESGEILASYPDARGRAVVIHVVGKYPLNGCASRFYERASAVIEAAGLSLEFMLFEQDES